jgi:hypothetical protein
MVLLEQAVRVLFDRSLPPQATRALCQLLAQRGHEELPHGRVKLDAVQSHLVVEGFREQRRDLNPHFAPILDGHCVFIALPHGRQIA